MPAIRCDLMHHRCGTPGVEPSLGVPAVATMALARIRRTRGRGLQAPCDSRDTTLLQRATRVPAVCPETHKARALRVWHSFCLYKFHRPGGAPYMPLKSMLRPRSVARRRREDSMSASL